VLPSEENAVFCAVADQRRRDQHVGIENGPHAMARTLAARAAATASRTTLRISLAGTSCVRA
jgi:hypothetical protein